MTAFSILLQQAMGWGFSTWDGCRFAFLLNSSYFLWFLFITPLRETRSQLHNRLLCCTSAVLSAVRCVQKVISTFQEIPNYPEGSAVLMDHPNMYLFLQFFCMYLVRKTLHATSRSSVLNISQEAHCVGQDWTLRSWAFVSINITFLSQYA